MGGEPSKDTDRVHADVDALGESVVFDALGEPESKSKRLFYREIWAGLLAFGLLLIFAGILFAPVIYSLWCRSSPPSELIEYAKNGTAVVVGLLGAVIAFYFSQKRLE